MKLRIEAELDYDADLMHGDDAEARRWFFDDILWRDRLTLHSKEIGDEIGELTITVIGISVPGAYQVNRIGSRRPKRTILGHQIRRKRDDAGGAR